MNTDNDNDNDYDHGKYISVISKNYQTPINMSENKIDLDIDKEKRDDKK